MTTLQARNWAQAAQRATGRSDHSRRWATVRAALGIAVLVALLAAGIAIRALVYVHP